MLAPSLFAIVLVVVAFVLIAWEASGTPRNPRLAALGVLLFLFGSGLHFGSASLFGGFIALLTSTGGGLVAASVVLALRNVSPRAFFILGLLLIILAGSLHAVAQHVRGSATEITFLLELGPDDQIEEVEPVLHAYEARYEQAFPSVSLAADEDLAQTYLVYVRNAERADALMAALRGDRENVDSVELNRTMGLVPPVPVADEAAASGTALANDPLAAEQWALDLAHGHAAHALLRTAEPARKARVAIVDTGVDGAHEDLSATFFNSPGNTDGNGHGTHCAGIAGAATNNGLGVASLNWDGRFVEVAGYRALDASGLGSLESIAQAIIDAAQDDADVISLSLGDSTPLPPKVLTEAVEFAQRRGAIVVASAGNSNRDATHHVPSNMDGVIAVAAVDSEGRKATFSNTIATMRRPIAAPGVDILSLLPDGRYAPKSGTSMAAPFVSGLLGVMRALNPDLSAAEVYQIIHETGTVVEESDRIGRVVNAEAAIQEVLGGGM